MAAVAVVRDFFSYKKIFATRTGNALGLQIVRIVLARLLLFWRRRRCPERNLPEVRHLASEGYCVLENFLPPEEFEAVRAEFDEIFAAGRFSIGAVDRQAVANDTAKLDWAAGNGVSPAISAFRDNDRFMAILRGHEGRRADELMRLGDVKCMFWLSRRIDEPTNRPTAETSNCDLHADTFHTITKAFLYLGDTDESNGSHIYVPRSHRLSLGRLKLDYLNSIRTMFGAPRTTDTELRDIGLAPLTMNYPANTLIIANEQGFHARGNFGTNKPRHVLYFDYRSHPFK